MSRDRCPTWRSITLAQRSRSSTSGSRRPIDCAAMRIAARGFRSSCARTARNSSFRRPASSSSSVRWATRRSRFLFNRSSSRVFRCRSTKTCTFARKNFGDDRHGQVVHGAALVALQAIQVRHVHAGHEDDRRLPEARMVADHLRQLEAVQVRHADVHDDDRELVLQKMLECLARRAGRHEIGANAPEDRLIGQELGRLVVDQQHVGLFAGLGADGTPFSRELLIGAATCEGTTTAVRCSPASPGNRTRPPRDTSRGRPSSPSRSGR